MSKYVFFIQLEPDIDHTVPIAYKLNQAEQGSVTLICLNPLLDIYSDYRLKYLIEQNVSVIYLHHISIINNFLFFISYYLTRIPKVLMKILPGRIWPHLYSNLKEVSRPDLKNFFKKNKTKVITIDQALPVKMMKSIVEVAKECGIPTVCLTTANPARIYEKSDDENMKMFDYMMRPHEISPFGELSINNPKEVILGCMRYCKEWQIINNSLIKDYFSNSLLPQKNEKRNILIFERSTKGFLNNHEIVEELSNNKKFNVIFKGRPRLLLPKKMYEDTVNSLPSSFLITWADIVVCSVSSICLEVLAQKKTLIYPKFIAPDELATYEKYESCLKVDNKKELLDAVEKYSNVTVKDTDYNQNIDNLFLDVVYNKNSELNVLENYKNFFQDISSSL